VTVAVAFKTKNPALIADYFAAREVTASDWRAKVDAFKSSIGGREVTGTSFYDGGWAVTGYRAEKYGEELPAGWRFDGAKRDVVPAKRTPEGKEIVQTLAGLTLHGDRFPGCPGILFAEGFSVFPRVAKIGDDYFLTLSKVPREEKANALDPDIWEPVKLSEYHAALEAAEMVAS
jgi:hypothetical protein